MWLSRDQSVMLDNALAVIAQWPETTLATAEDRADQITWVLLEAGGQRAWRPWDDFALAFSTSSLPTGQTAHSGSVVHNRPGPP